MWYTVKVPSTGSRNIYTLAGMKDYVVYVQPICPEDTVISWRGHEETETMLVKKPEDGEVLELIDVECVYPGTRSGECTAPPGYKCPFRQVTASLPRAQDEMFTTKGKGLARSPPLRITPVGRRPGSK